MRASRAARGPCWRGQRCDGVLGRLVGGNREVALEACRARCIRFAHKALQDGSTALIIAAERGHKHTVELLLDHGADMEAKTRASQMRQLF